MNTGGFSLALQQMRLEFTPVAASGAYGYGLAVETDDRSGWRDVSASTNPLVGGGTFNLYPTDVRQQDDLTLVLSGSRLIPPDPGPADERFEFSYTAIVRADPRQNWFRFEVQVDSPRAIPLAMT